MTGAGIPECTRYRSHVFKRSSGCSLTDLRFCCAADVVTVSEARELDAYRDGSNRLLDSAGPEVGTWIVAADLASVGGQDL